MPSEQPAEQVIAPIQKLNRTNRPANRLKDLIERIRPRGEFTAVIQRNAADRARVYAVYLASGNPPFDRNDTSTPDAIETLGRFFILMLVGAAHRCSILDVDRLEQLYYEFVTGQTVINIDSDQYHINIVADDGADSDEMDELDELDDPDDEPDDLGDSDDPNDDPNDGYDDHVESDSDETYF